MSATGLPQPSRAVPVRTIAAAIAMILATAAALYLLYEVRQILVWLLVAAFFTVALSPVVGWLERHVGWLRRSLATVAVFVLVVVLIAALVTIFAVPLTREIGQFAQQLPQLIADARSGRGVVGRLLERTNALSYLQENQDTIRRYLSSLTSSATDVLSGIANGVVGAVTVFVLALLMTIQAPKLVESTLNLVDDPRRRERVRRVGADCAKSITGYISGNLLISVICGVLTYAALKIMGVPFAGLLALFVGIADLIPLVGATLGAVVAVVAAAIHSVPALIVMAIFFVAYQQVENHLLQPWIFARTVKLNALVVIVAILAGADLAGVLGALLAIPVAGMLQVILRDVWDHNRGRTKAEATVGEEQTPVSESPVST